jgi:Glycosyl hydrolase family 46
MTDPKTPQAKSTTPLLQRILNMTGYFENSVYTPQSYSGISNNFDGQGISVGILQQNIGRGSLQPLLKKMDKEHPEVLKKVFGKDYESLHKMLGESHESQMQWAKQIQKLGKDGVNPWSRWKKEFQALGRTPEYQQIQIGAAQSVYNKALRLSKQFGLKSERGVAFMFDIVTQNGGIEKPGLQIGKDILKDIEALKKSGKDSEEARMIIIAEHRADACNPRWRSDVLKRKTTIAKGHGIVHSHRIDLDQQFGITLEPAQDLVTQQTTAPEVQAATPATQVRDTSATPEAQVVTDTTDVHAAAQTILEKCGTLEKGVSSYKGTTYGLKKDQEGLTITRNDQVIYQKTGSEEINKLQPQDVQALTAAAKQVHQEPSAAETYAKLTESIVQKAGQPERDTKVYRGKGYEFMRSDEGLRVRRDGSPIFAQTPQGETTLNKLNDLDALVFRQIEQRVTPQRAVLAER